MEYKKLIEQYLGCIVKRYKEKGVVILREGVLCIRFDNKKEDDWEELIGGEFDILTDYELKHINKDGSLK